MKKAGNIGIFAALFSIFVWSSTYISTKILVQSFSPLAIVTVRFTIGLIIMTILAPPRRRKINWREEWKIAVAGVLGIFLYFFLENNAARFTYASNVSIIVTTIPLITSLLAPLIYREEHFSFRFIWAFIVSMAGLVLIIVSGDGFHGIGILGDLLALAAALVFALYTLTLRGIHIDIPPLLLTRKTLFYGWIVIVTLSAASGNLPDVGTALSVPFIWHYLFLGVLASGLCFFTWALAIRNAGAVRSSQFIYLVPFITLVLSAIFLSEPVTLFKIIGLFLILSGVVLSQGGMMWLKRFFGARRKRKIF